MGDYLIENSFCLQSQITTIFTVTNLRENRLFASKWKYVSKKRTHNVKFYTYYFTSNNEWLQRILKNWESKVN